MKIGRLILMTMLVGWQSWAGAEPVPMSVIGEMKQAKQLAAEGRREEALKLVDQFLKALERGDHTGDKAYGDVLCNAAKIRRECGDAQGGLQVAELALKVARDRQNENEHALGLAYFAIAMCEASLRHTEASEEAAAAGWEVLGKVPYKNPGVPNLIPRCSTLVNLGGVYHGMEDYLMAEKYYRQAARDSDRLMGFPPQDVSYDLGKYGAAGRAYSSIGGFYVSIGDHRRAIPYLIESLATRSKAGPSSSSMGREDTYMNLSRAYLALGDSQKAENYSWQGIQAATRGVMSTRYVVARGTLGAVRASQGEYAEALKIMEEMAAQFREIRKDPSFEHPSVVNNIGWMKLRLNQFKEARKTLTKAYTLVKGSGQEQSELAGNILFSLSELEFLTGNAERGIVGLQKAATVYERELERVVGFGSESQKLAYLQRLRGKTDFVIGVHFGRFPNDNALAREALLMLFQRKDRMTQLTRESVALTRLVGADNATRRKIEQMRSNLGLLNLSLGVFDREEALEFGQDWMVDLEREMRVLSEEARGTGNPRVSPVSIPDVAAALDDDEILVEYVIYQPYEPQVPKEKKKALPLRCGVFVLNAKGEVSSRDLGEFGEIQQAAVAFRRSLARPGDDGYRALGKTLHAKLVAPIGTLVGSAASWRVAPDGQLHLIPFEVLIDADGSFLTEKVTTTYLATGGELARAARKGSNDGRMTIIAGPEYAIQRKRPASQSESEVVPAQLAKFWEDVSTLGAPLQFPSLPGTLKEAGTIKKIMPHAELVTGAAAKERAFRTLGDARVIHIATHGFFLNEDTISAKGQRGLKRVKPAPVQGLPETAGSAEANWVGQRSLDHPLLNCGLAFAGANHLHDGRDDGILTGMEVLGMDLNQTELIVLSACETGVGKVVTGEGVLGLRQAFRVAGASSMVMSLWKVSDEATAELMGQFYQGLADGKAKGEALRQAAAELRSKDQWRHPAYWSAFLLSGDNGPLQKPVRGGRSK